jgi:hypothetical protein
MAKPIIEAITEQTLPEFAVFLAENMPVCRSTQEWIVGLQHNWSELRPNYGFLMRDQGNVVGGIGAFYADRTIRGQKERFCNITSWCVLDSHRKYSMQLAMHIVAQEGYHFTDFSPTKIVAGTLQFFKFKSLDERVAVLPNLPIIPLSGSLKTDARQIENNLTGAEMMVWKDHAKFPWLQHLIFGKPDDWCHLIYKRGNFKGMPCANVIYISNGESFNRYFNRLSWHFFWQGMMTTHIESRSLDILPRLAFIRAGFNPKQFLSPTLEADDIDYLYSETVALNL